MNRQVDSSPKRKKGNIQQIKDNILNRQEGIKFDEYLETNNWSVALPGKMLDLGLLEIIGGVFSLFLSLAGGSNTAVSYFNNTLL